MKLALGSDLAPTVDKYWMTFIDYPPGGLGNFVAQVLTGQASNTQALCWHHSAQNYDIALVQPNADAFRAAAASWQPRASLAIGHSWGLIDLIRQRGLTEIITVQVQHCWLELYVNLWTKAMPGVPPENSSHAMTRDECKRQLKHLPQTMSFTHYHSERTVCFDDFYGKKSDFLSAVEPLNSAVKPLHLLKHFRRTQAPVIDILNNIRTAAHTGQCIDHYPAWQQAAVDYLRSQ